MRRMTRRGSFVLSGAALASCSMPANPAFRLTDHEADRYLRSVRDEPVLFDRPVLVLAGYQDPGWGVWSIGSKMRRLALDPDQIIAVEFFVNSTFDQCREKVIDILESTNPSADPDLTVEVDVIGISMGGLVARHAARASTTAPKRLRIGRLFTIATPHRGANLATLPTADVRQRDMRIDSLFLTDLNADPTSADFEIVAYGRLGDSIVGIENSAPYGSNPWWIPNRPFDFAHLTSASDSRILADVVRRLQDQTPFTRGAPGPPPE